MFSLSSCPASERARIPRSTPYSSNVVIPAKAGIQISRQAVSTVRWAGLLVSDTGAHFHDVGRPPLHVTALLNDLAGLPPSRE